MPTGRGKAKHLSFAIASRQLKKRSLKFQKARQSETTNAQFNLQLAHNQNSRYEGERMSRFRNESNEISTDSISLTDQKRDGRTEKQSDFGPKRGCMTAPVCEFKIRNETKLYAKNGYLKMLTFIFAKEFKKEQLKHVCAKKKTAQSSFLSGNMRCWGIDNKNAFTATTCPQRWIITAFATPLHFQSTPISAAI